MRYNTSIYPSFKGSNTVSIHVDISDDVLFNWVKTIYNQKDVEWIISSNKFNKLTLKDIIDFKTQLDEITKGYQIKKTDNKYLLTTKSRLSDFNIGSKYLVSMTNVDCQYYILYIYHRT